MADTGEARGLEMGGGATERRALLAGTIHDSVPGCRCTRCARCESSRGLKPFRFAFRVFSQSSVFPLQTGPSGSPFPCGKDVHGRECQPAFAAEKETCSMSQK